MKAYIFPGQGAQFTGMGKDVYEASETARELFKKANEILGFDITKIMFEGTAEELKETKVTQPAIFLHSVALFKALGEEAVPQMVAGHSLGEISALVANGVLSFEDSLRLVSQRAQAMQKACDTTPSTMAAILGLEDELVEAVNEACERLKERGAKRALVLPVGGAFHSPLMEPAREELAAAIEMTTFSEPKCPIYQNVSTTAVTDPAEIKKNLLFQLTAPVKWTQSVQNMIADGATEFIEVGPGKVLQGLVKKIDRQAQTSSASI